MLDRTRLAKVLAMTTSTNDSEALTAIRKANEIVKSENMLWEDVLVQLTSRVVNITMTRGERYPTSGAVYEPDENWTAPHLTDKVTIDMMFRKIFEKLQPGLPFYDFVNDVYKKFQLYGQLTPNQYNAIRQAYTRASYTRASR